MTNHFITHVELSSTNVPASQQFFSQLFGWETSIVQPMDYCMANLGEGKTSVGFPAVSEEHQIPAGQVWVYVHTDDIDATIAKAQELGGEIVNPKMEIPTIGWMAIFGEPGGNKICVMQPMPMPESA